MPASRSNEGYSVPVHQGEEQESNDARAPNTLVADNDDSGVHVKQPFDDDDDDVDEMKQISGTSTMSSYQGGNDRVRKFRKAALIILICATFAGSALGVALGGGRSQSTSQGPTTNPNPNADGKDYSYGPPQDWGKGSCGRATAELSPLTHIQPVEGSPISRIAFASCFRPYLQVSDALWRHMRESFQPELFIWLGDNMYMDTHTSMNDKRRSYNQAKEDQYYSRFGPVAEPKIPTVGIWDDHDFGEDNMGREYPCLSSSQNEFVNFFNLPPTDPRHPSQGSKQQFGIYSSHMFSVPHNPDQNGIHIINLDNRSHRSPTFAEHGPCERASSTILGAAQWEWLEQELLGKKSVIKLVSSGIQVLPPTNKDRPAEEYCAYDGEDGTFVKSMMDMEEDGPEAEGTKYEGWGEMPAERARLLRMAQESINTGRAEHVIFLTGDQHWAELQAKRMSDSEDAGPSRILFSVTASGIDQHYAEAVPNMNRLRVRTADKRGDGSFVEECNFPFVVDGKEYDDCVDVFGSGTPGCAIRTNPSNEMIDWGDCLEAKEELVARNDMTYGKTNICTDNYHHTCAAQANYGGIEVDWEAGNIEISLFTPHENEQVASSVRIDLYN